MLQQDVGGWSVSEVGMALGVKWLIWTSCVMISVASVSVNGSNMRRGCTTQCHCGCRIVTWLGRHKGKPDEVAIEAEVIPGGIDWIRNPDVVSRSVLLPESISSHETCDSAGRVVVPEPSPHIALGGVLEQ